MVTAHGFSNFYEGKLTGPIFQRLFCAGSGICICEQVDNFTVETQ